MTQCMLFYGISQHITFFFLSLRFPTSVSHHPLFPPRHFLSTNVTFQISHTPGYPIKIINTVTLIEWLYTFINLSSYRLLCIRVIPLIPSAFPVFRDAQNFVPKTNCVTSSYIRICFLTTFISSVLPARAWHPNY